MHENQSLVPYKTHLAKDKILQALMAGHPGFEVAKKKNIFLFLCDSIIGQQLSIKVAAIIFQRFLGLLPTKDPKPQEIADLPYETLRTIGLSHSKVSYIKNTCTFFIEHQITDNQLHRMRNEDVVEYLTQIKGVGTWTVEMVLMFALGREDVFSSSDLGLQKAMSHLYSIDYQSKKDLQEKMQAIAKGWTPYRTYACLYLWKYFDKTDG